MAFEPEPVVSYLEDRRQGSSIYYNIAILLFATLLAKITTNFVSGQPGFAGFRVCPKDSVLIVAAWAHKILVLQVQVQAQRSRVVKEA